jgi:hypothetical protein
MSTASYDEHTFRAQGSDGQACVLDHTSLKTDQISTDVKAIFTPLDLSRGDVVVAVGWAMAEDLEKLL